MSAWQASAVPRQLLHTGHQCCWQAASQISHKAMMVVPRHGYPLLAAEHSLCKAPWSGTPCRTTSAHSRTMSPLDSAWKHGFSLATSVLSALETSCQLRYINSHLPLLLPLPLPLPLVLAILFKSSIGIGIGNTFCQSIVTGIGNSFHKYY